MPISVPVPEPECRVDGDCPSRQACLQEVCRNPCTELKPCGRNAECSVQNTLPQRTMVCMCIPGYVGDADVYCELRKILLILLSLFQQFIGCIYCVKMFRILAYHMLTTETKTLLLNVNPLPAAPAPEPGCTSNSQCGDKEICRDRSCINPCIAANPCAPNAICSVRAHSVSCNCPSGYTGDSFSNCYPSK